MACGAVASGLLLFVAFPPLEWTWAAWLALVPLWFAARHCTLRVALRMGYAGMLLFWLLNLQWLKHVTTLGWVAVCAYCAVYALPSIWVANRLRHRRGIAVALGMAAAWVAGEYLRGILFGGFPWNLLGVALAPHPVWIQTAELGGVYLLSGWLACMSGLGVVLLEQVASCKTAPKAATKTGITLALLAAGVLLPMGWGQYRLRGMAAALPDADALHVALAQTAIPQDEKWSLAKVEGIYSRLHALSSLVAAYPETELLIWPEAALPDDVLHSEISLPFVQTLLSHLAAPSLLTGSLDTRMDETRTPRYYNAAILFHADGRPAGNYAKRNLVIGGEYIPLSGWIPTEWKIRLMLPENISRGKQGIVMRAGLKHLPFAPLICFEDVLPWLARADVRMGARFLVNLTNDAWFDPSSARLQHMRNATLRAVENRVPLVRTANTGVSCVIGADGRVEAIADLPPDVPHLLPATVHVPKQVPVTLYARIGDSLAWLALLWTALYAFVQYRFPKKATLRVNT